MPAPASPEFSAFTTGTTEEPSLPTILTAASLVAAVTSMVLAVSMPLIVQEFPINWFVMLGGSVLVFGFVVASGHSEQHRIRPPDPSDGA